MSAVTAITGFAHLTDLPCYQLRYLDATVVVSAYGAQVLSYQPKPEQELLWLSPTASWQQQQPIRGGVPVCWPWFGPAAAQFNPQQQALPNHGLVRTRVWQLTRQHQTAQYSSLTLAINVNDLPQPNAPSVTLELTLILSSSGLTIQLRCDSTILQQAALHSYFAITDLNDTKVLGIGDDYYDKVKNNQRVTADPELSFNQEIDRVYNKPAAVLQLKTGNKTLAIAQHGYDSTIVWNPAAERCAAIIDAPDNGYQQFVCVETARLNLALNAPLALEQQITLQQ